MVFAGHLYGNQAVEVIEDFRIAQDGGAPVEVDAALEFSMSFRDLRLELLDVHLMNWWGAREAHVDIVVGEGVEVGGLRVLADGGEALEGDLDVLARMRDHPVPSCVSIVYRATIAEGVPNHGLFLTHCSALGLVEGDLETLRLTRAS